MASLKEEAQEYEPTQTKNIADLEVVSVDLETEERTGTTKEGKPFSYKVVVIDNEEYRVPVSVLKSIKAILVEKPNLKTVKVVKQGSGLETEYTVIPLA